MSEEKTPALREIEQNVWLPQRVLSCSRAIHEESDSKA